MGGPHRRRLASGLLSGGGDSGVLCPVAASFRSRKATATGSTSKPRMHRAESGCLSPGEEGSVGKGARGQRRSGRASERACVRARGGEAGRRLVTQQNARARPPRVRNPRAWARRGFLEISTERAGPPSPLPTFPSTLAASVVRGFPSRVTRPLAANCPSTRRWLPGETAGSPVV